MAPLKSWLKIDPKTHFSIINIPFGIISTSNAPHPRPAVAIGSWALDLHAFTNGNGFSKLSIVQPHQSVFSQPTLNDFASLGRPIHRVVREYIQSVFLEGGPFPDVLQQDEQLQKAAPAAYQPTAGEARGPPRKHALPLEFLCLRKELPRAASREW